VQQQQLRESEQELAMQILESCTDGSVVVRKEALIALSKFFALPAHASSIRLVALELANTPCENPKSPWVISPEHTEAITNVLSKHLEQADLFGAIGSGINDPNVNGDGTRRGAISPRSMLFENNKNRDGTAANGAESPREGWTGERQAGQIPGQTEPQDGANSPKQSRNTLMAAGYVGLWLALYVSWVF